MTALKLYKSYSFTDKDPIIDRFRTAVEDSGLNLAKLAEESGVSSTTLYNWDHGPTRRPQFASMAAAFGAMGYDLLPVKRGHGTKLEVVKLRAQRLLPAPPKRKAG